MKIIIMGSKGFIGSHLLSYYQGKGYDVKGADIIEDTSTEDYFLLNKTDPVFSTIFKKNNFDLCINCSGAASVPESLVDPFKDFFLNTINVFKMLDAIKSYSLGCRFINLSSAAIYGNPKSLPVREEDDPKPLSPYGYHKYQSEQICGEFNKFFGIKTCSLRVFSVYGPGLKKQLFWDLFNKIKADKPFVMFGTGNESRDFIFISDLVRAIDAIVSHSDFEADIVNVANGEEVRVKDAISTFMEEFGSKTEYSFSGSIRKGDPSFWLADISKLRSFGYKKTIELKEGLTLYCAWITKE